MGQGTRRALRVLARVVLPRRLPEAPGQGMHARAHDDLCGHYLGLVYWLRCLAGKAYGRKPVLCSVAGSLKGV